MGSESGGPCPREASGGQSPPYGFDHEQLTYRFQGRDFRLTDVGGEIIQKMLA